MAITLGANFGIAAPNPIDDRYLSTRLLSGVQLPYSADTEVYSTIVESRRYVGLTVNINNDEWWFKDDINTLVEKIFGGTGDVSDAENGLYLIDSGTTVVLGGALLSGTTISLNSNNFSITGTTASFVMNPAGYSINLSICDGTSCGVIGVGLNPSLSSCDGTIGTKICLNENGLYYSDDYSTRWDNERYIPDIAYVTGYTKCSSNVDTICLITTSGYVTLPTDEIITLNISGPPYLIWLLDAPKYGQRVTIVDVSGNALSCPITVCSHTYLINGGSSSMINTNYGSITYVFNCCDFWSATAFVN